MVWSCFPFIRSGQNQLADRRRGGKTTSGNGQAWSSASPRGQWRTGKMEKTGCKIICGAPTTLAVKILMMMMMMKGKKWYVILGRRSSCNTRCLWRRSRTSQNLQTPRSRKPQQRLFFRRKREKIQSQQSTLTRFYRAATESLDCSPFPSLFDTAVRVKRTR